MIQLTRNPTLKYIIKKTKKETPTKKNQKANWLKKNPLLHGSRGVVKETRIHVLRPVFFFSHPEEKKGHCRLWGKIAVHKFCTRNLDIISTH